jgi:hypothetical protein
MRRTLAGVLLAVLVLAATQAMNVLSQNPPTSLADLQKLLRQEEAQRFADGFASFVKSGGTAPTAGALSHTISALTAYVNGHYVSQAATSATYTPNRRTYVFATDSDSAEGSGPPTTSGGASCTYKSRSARLLFVECAAGSDVPTMSGAASLVLLAVDTNATAITKAWDLRRLTPVPLSMVRPGAYAAGEFGVRCDGVTDDTMPLQRVIDTVLSFSTVYLGPGGCIISSTLAIRDKQNFRLVGVGAQGDALGGTRLIWNGANGGTVLEFNRTRDATVEHLSVYAGTGVPGVGIDVRQDKPSRTLSTNLWLRDLMVRNATTACLRVTATPDQNNDLHQIDRFRCISYKGMNGILFEHNQGRDIDVSNCAIAGPRYGINFVHGTAQLRNCSWAGDNTRPDSAAIELGLTSDPVIVYVGASSVASAITFIGTATDGNHWHADHCVIKFDNRGPLTLIGMQINDGQRNDDLRICMSPSMPEGAAFTAIGNILPTTIENFYAGIGNTKIASVGNMIWGKAGGVMATNDEYGLTNGTMPSRLTLGTVKSMGSAALGSLKNWTGRVKFQRAQTATVTFATPEMDANYRIFLSTPDVPESFWVPPANRQTTGFTIVSSNGSSTATVDWWITR